MGDKERRNPYKDDQEDGEIPKENGLLENKLDILMPCRIIYVPTVYYEISHDDQRKEFSRTRGNDERFTLFGFSSLMNKIKGDTHGMNVFEYVMRDGNMTCMAFAELMNPCLKCYEIEVVDDYKKYFSIQGKNILVRITLTEEQFQDRRKGIENK